MDKPIRLRLLGLSLLLSLSACGSSSPEKIMPDFKQNPNPKRVYQLTLTVANAPGPFKSVEGFMQFDVSTRECLPPSSENGGHLWPVPTETIPFVWTRVSDTEYTGVVYIDGMLDEDYFGHGVCRWKFMQARAALKETGGKKGETRFVPNIYQEKLESQQAEITYFAKASYLDDEVTSVDDPVSYGRTDRSKMAHLRDDELFTITITPKAATP